MLITCYVFTKYLTLIPKCTHIKKHTCIIVQHPCTHFIYVHTNLCWPITNGHDKAPCDNIINSLHNFMRKITFILMMFLLTKVSCRSTEAILLLTYQHVVSQWESKDILLACCVPVYHTNSSLTILTYSLLNINRHLYYHGACLIFATRLQNLVLGSFMTFIFAVNTSSCCIHNIVAYMNWRMMLLYNMCTCVAVLNMCIYICTKAEWILF